MANAELPDSAQLLFYASARIKEINTVKNLLLAQNGTKLAFQKLPRHMRRRVMGYTIKRVPKSIKQIHQNQLEKSGLPPKSKRPSRKYRRRPVLLNAEITRRQRVNKWMETHIWHAKRFHMVNKWSYKIPERSADKSYRACYRATMKHCLLQDISYMGCLELQGSENYLTKKLKLLTRSEEGLSMHAMAYINGNREGKVFIYQHSTGAPIGNINFVWKPDDMVSRTIWLWVHPASFQAVLEELILLFKLTEDSQNPKQWINEKTKLVDLRFELNRFRLTGPLAQAVLVKALKPSNSSQDINPWFRDYLENDDQRQLYSEQIDYWNSVRTVQMASMLSPRIVFSLVVNDPRYSVPNQRTKALNCEGKPSNVPPPKGLSNGAIWNDVIRKNVTDSKLTNAAINELRSELLVPGSEMLKQGAQVPMMLIQRPGNSKTGFCSGWDVIIPKGWAQCTWVCLIMWGARAGGHRETENINFELSQQDILPPDTKSGANENKLLDDAQRTRYFRLPPNKRPNFNKFATSSPFECNWKVLLKDWSTKQEPIDEFYVLRNRQILEDLQLHLKNRKHKFAHATLDNYLVPVKIVPKHGLVARYSMICLPEAGDVSKLPVEAPREDVHKKLRNKLRKEHKVLLQRLKRKRHIDRSKRLPVTIDKSISEEFMNKMRNLWLPPIDASGLRTSCSREILGFVTKGGVSFSNGNCHGIGYIPFTALTTFLSTSKRNQVLCRNTDSRHYQYATLEILQT